MDLGNYFEPQGQADELLIKHQYLSDFFIALAYFSLSLEIIYFVKKSAVFPYIRWVLVHFSAFIGLCGATHLLNLWMYNTRTMTFEVLQTIAKILTAIVSCATAIVLFNIIPDLLGVKRRELFLKNKAAELDREVGLIRTQEESGRHMRMHATTALSSLMQETELTPEQRLMVETVLKCSNLLAAPKKDVLDLSRLEDGTLKLVSETFDRRSAFTEVINLIKKLPITLQPEFSAAANE